MTYKLFRSRMVWPVRLHWILAGLWALSLGFVWPIIAWAHPMGNFTINRYSRLELAAEQIQLHYIVDMAEVPSIGEKERIDRDGDGGFSDAERQEYLANQVYTLRNNLYLLVNGQPLELVPHLAELEFPEGQGGLLTTRLTIKFIAALPASKIAWQAEYRDENYAERRLGWQEIVVQSGPGVTILESTAPDQDISQALRSYPQDLLQEPVQVKQVDFRFAPAAGSVAAPSTVAESPVADQAALEVHGATTPLINLQNLITGLETADPFAELITGPTLGPAALILAFFAAFGWGAVHAFSPGHGKTVVAAYLIGSRGTARHAFFLGLTTTVTHTLGVFALGGITLFVSQFILPEHLYPWLSVASGLLVVVLGISLLGGCWRQLKEKSDHDHEHEHHHHDHDHHHDHHHSHSHLPPGTDGTPVTWKSLLALGVSGGLLPCPSALVVMLSAIALNRIGFGLLLIVVFSLGLASVLTATGLLFVYAGRLFSRLPAQRPLLRILPVASALIVTLIGVGITIQALTQMGWLTLTS